MPVWKSTNPSWPGRVSTRIQRPASDFRAAPSSIGEFFAASLNGFVSSIPAVARPLPDLSVTRAVPESPSASSGSGSGSLRPPEALSVSAVLFAGASGFEHAKLEHTKTIHNATQRISKLLGDLQSQVLSLQEKEAELKRTTSLATGRRTGSVARAAARLVAAAANSGITLGGT